MTRIDALLDHFWDGYRSMSLRRPGRSEVRYFAAWKRAVALAEPAPANPAWLRYLAADKILREAAATLSYIPSFQPATLENWRNKVA